MTSKKIWIPSIQEFKLFQELTVIQYKDLHKQMGDKEDFIGMLNSLLASNGPWRFDTNSLTIIDRFVIFLYLKIYSCGKDLPFTRICDKCNTETSKSFDLNNMLDTIAPVVDRSFKSVFPFKNYQIICDIPNIACADSYIQDIDDINDQLDNYLFSHIRGVVINKNIFNTNSQKDMKAVLPHILMSDILSIKDKFIDPLYKSFTDLSLMEMHCSNDKCKSEIFKLNFSTGNITDIIKILYNDDSLDNILSIITDVSANYHLDYKFYENISPLELDIIFAKLIKSHQSEAPKEQIQENQSTDLFDQYRSETKGMVEQPSEFM
jgi:hypothetical protein